MTTALLIVDMLNDFVDGTLANAAAKPTVEPIARLAEAARRADWPVIYANDAHQQGDLEFAVFGEHALAGSDGAAVIPDLAPAASDLVVPKRFYSSFTSTDLDATCRVHGIDSLVLVGQHTDCCCRHTTYDAFLRGIAMTVVSDATCVYEPVDPATVEERQQQALQYLGFYYNARIADSDTVLAQG
ncbi:MAG: cysteine hydrolase [Actinomycetota bacterium]|nr:cysteine hydrolase [Actinomycetota bacterium]